jgi:hypothetical protein
VSAVSPALPLVRVGVSGHRVPPKLPEEAEAPLRALLDRLFAAIVDAAREAENNNVAPEPTRGDDHATRFVIVSSLAEGSDRIVAEAGLAAGFELEAVLPLSRAEYARDFETHASRVEFEQLLARASAVFELDEAADDRPHAYEAAGLFMLAKVDLLIAIWDGENAAGIGGTAQIVSRAIADGIFVVWIEPTNPSAMLISWPGAVEVRPATADALPQNNFRPADAATIARAVNQILNMSTR